MGDQQHRAPVAADRVGQDAEALQVEVVRRLVEDEEVRHMVLDHQAAEAQPHPFAAAERVARLVPRLRGKQRPVEPHFQFVIFQMVAVARLRGFQHGRRSVEAAVFLIETDIRKSVPADFARRGLQFSGQQLYEGGFARSVAAPQADAFPAANRRVEWSFPERRASGVGEIDAPELRQQLAVVELCIVEIYSQQAFALLHGAQSGDLFAVAADDLGVLVPEPRGCPLAAVLQSLAQNARHLVLIFLALHSPFFLPFADLLRPPAGQFQSTLRGVEVLFDGLSFDLFLLTVEIVISAVAFQSQRREFVDRFQQVQKRDVVAHDHYGSPRVADEGVELPPPRLVEMVGRLVQQEYLGLAERRSRQQELGFLPAAQGVGRAIRTDVMQSPAVERRTAFRFDVPIVAQGVVMGRVGASGADGVQGRTFFGDAQRPGDAQSGQIGLLGDIIGACGAGDAARRGCEFACEQFQERGFSRSVAADDGCLSARRHGKSDRFEKRLPVGIVIGEITDDDMHRYTINGGLA